MFIVFDNLTAAIVGSVVFLIVLGVNTRIAEMSVDEASNYVAKRYGTDLAEWMEEDLIRLGEGIEEANEATFENPVDSASGLLTKSFTFYRDSVNVGSVLNNTKRLSIRYDLKYVAKGDVAGEEVNLYRVLRYERLEGGSWKYTGGAVPLISYFKIDMLNRNAAPVEDPKSNKAQVRNTRVRFTIVTPFQTSRTAIRKVHYGSTILIDHSEEQKIGS